MIGLRKVLTCAVLLVAAGCASGPLGLRPEIRDLAHTDGERDEIGFSFDIRDKDRTLDWVEVEYSTDAGDTWHVATLVAVVGAPGAVSGNRLADLDLDEQWTACRFRWDSLANLVAVDGLGSALLRVTPLDIDAAGSPATVTVNVNNEPVVTVTEPNGGETWSGGGSASVSWDSLGIVESVKIELSVDAGGSWTTLVEETPGDGTEAVSVPNTPGSQCLVRVSRPDGAVSDVSNGLFTIRGITVASPNGAEVWRQGSSQTVTWGTVGTVGNVAIELSTDGGASWTTLLEDTPNDGSEPVTLPGTPSAECLVRVREVGDTPSDVSDSAFTIKSVTVTSPNGHEEWPIGTTQTVEWTSAGVDQVLIELSRDGNWVDGDGSDVEVLSASEPGTAGSYGWTVLGPFSPQCLMRVSDLSDGLITDESNEAFMIADWNGLVAYWKLDDGSGDTAVDSSGNENHGTLQGSPTWTAGRVGGALSFDGIDDRVSFTSGEVSTTTIAVWVKMRGTGTSGAPRIVRMPAYFLLFLHTEDHLNFVADRDGTYGAWQVDLVLIGTGWHHLAVSYDSTSLANDATMYVDGSPAASVEIHAPAGNMVSNSGTAEIGNAGSGRPFDGLIDDVRIYNRVLSAAEILALSQLGVSSVSTWYVDDDAPGPVHDGLTWDTAFIHPQHAMDAAMPGSEIRVAEGTYVLRNPISETVVLTMHPGVAIYGGYAGCGASDPDEHDSDVFVTTLDGEDVAYHVVVGASDGTLDGFTVTRGDTGGVWPDPFGGGGMDNHGVTGLTVANCTFTGNRGIYGGGIRNIACSPVITGCTFEANWASRGGGILNDGASPAVANCMFVANGSGMGGGIQNWAVSSPTISNSTFAENHANLDGAGMHNIDSSAPTVLNCVFLGNSAERCGGAIENRESTNPTIISCTFVANSADISGGAIHSRDNSTGTLTNCILWENTAANEPEILIGTSSTIDVAYSCVEGGWTGTGNIDADPLFIDAASGDLRLQPGSPCIDAADGDAAPATDIDGNPRHDDPGTPDTGTGAVTCADMGAYEFQGTTSYKVVDLTTGELTGHLSLSDLETNDEYKTTKLVLRLIRAGTFQMGDEVGGHGADELPVHTVNITQPFYMGVFEVTQRQWFEIQGDWPSYFTTTSDKRPVETVSWDDCQWFLTQLSAKVALTFRLPTEAEWEYGCKATTSTNYSFGDAADGAYMWYDVNSGSETHEVGTRLPNPLGLYDVHGNVVEWCRDWYAADYYASSPTSDPPGPASGTKRVLRGGSWSNNGYAARSARRAGLPSSDRTGGAAGRFGLRAVLGPQDLVTRGLVGHWKFDETGGTTAADSSSNNYDGTLVGGPVWQPTDGKSDGALRFDGANDYVDMGSPAGVNITKNLTLAAWIRPDDLVGNQAILGKVKDAFEKQYLLICRGATLGFDYETSGNNFAVQGGSLTADWHHVAVSVDGSLHITIYVDGNPVKSGTAPLESHPGSSGDRDLVVGKLGGTYNSTFFDGLIDDVRIYNRVLSADEVARLAGGG